MTIFEMLPATIISWGNRISLVWVPRIYIIRRLSIIKPNSNTLV